MATENTHLIKLIGESIGMQKMTSDAQIAQQALDKTGAQVGKVSQILNKSTQYYVKHGKVTQKTMMDVKTNTGQTFKVIQDNTKGATKQMGDFQRALARVAIVVPMWFLFRQAFMAVIQSIQEGARYWIEFDKAFTKASLVVHTKGEDINEVLITLKENMLSLARDTGISATVIADAFYRFGTLGIDVETAWAGAEAVVRGAVATFGDAGVMAKSTALAMSLLGDTLEQNLSVQERMNLLMAKQTALWKTNLMESNEFAGALERFVPTAKVFNLTLDQSIALLATLHSAGIRGTRAGRLLRTSIQKLIENLGVLGKTLGIYVNPEIDDTWVSLTKVLGALSETSKTTSTIAPQFQKALSDIFGGIRSREVGQALLVMNEALQKNFDTINTEGGTAMEKINKLMESFKEQEESVEDATFKATERFKEMKKEIFMGLVKGLAEGITGMGTYADALNKISDALERLSKKSESATRKAIAYTKTILGYVPAIMELFDIAEKKSGGKSQSEFSSPTTGEPPTAETTEGGAPTIKMSRLSADTKERIQLLSKELDYIRMETRGFTEIEISLAKLNDLIKVRVEQHNKLDAVQDGTLKKLSEQEMLALALNENYEELAEKLNIFPEEEKELLKIAKEVNKVYEERLESVKKYSDTLRSSFEDAYAGLLKGGDIDAFLDSFKEKISNVWAESMSKQVSGQLGGIFEGMGGLFSGIEDPMIQGGIIAGQTIKRDIIDASFIAGQNMAKSMGVSAGARGAIPGAGITIGGGHGGSILDVAKEVGTSKATGGKGGKGGLFSALGGMGGIGQIAMGGMAGGWAGAGLTALSMINPLLGMAGGLIYGAFKKKKSFHKSSWTPQEAEKAMPNLGIDVAKPAKKYALESSRYFGRAGMGDINISLNIDKVTGTDEEIAGKISNSVKTEIIDAIETKVGRDLIRGNANNITI